MKIDSSLMFEPAKVGPVAVQLEQAGYDGAAIHLYRWPPPP
jgi:hypothetical protein